MTAFVTYTRVDPEERGLAGRSFSAQRRDLAAFLRLHAPAAVTGRFCDRPPRAAAGFPGLRAALNACRGTGAVLVVARLDRLPFADMGFAPFFADPAISLRVAALPEASAAELAIHARLLEQERAFDARRQDPEPAPDAGAGPVAGDPVLRIVLPMRQRGSTLRDIASALNRAGLSSASGTAWRPTQVSRLLRDLV